MVSWLGQDWCASWYTFTFCNNFLVVNFMGWQRLAESLDSGGMAMLRVHECTHSTAFGAGEPKLLAVVGWLAAPECDVSANANVSPAGLHADRCIFDACQREDQSGGCLGNDRRKTQKTGHPNPVVRADSE